MSSTTIWLSAFAATIIVSAISLIGVLVTPFDTVYFHKHIMKPLLSFAVGALAGDAFIHLIPEAMVEEEGSLSVSLTILAGIFTFFVLERHVEHLHSRFEHHDHHHHDADALGCTERGVHNADSTKHVDSLDNVGASCCVPNQTYSNNRNMKDVGANPSNRSNALEGRRGRGKIKQSARHKKRRSAASFPGKDLSVCTSSLKYPRVIREQEKEETLGVNAELALNGKKLANVAAVGWLNLISDAIHNFVDGVAIGGAFSASSSVGISTSFAILMHELPQEFGDFAILVNAGFSKRQALLMNFLTALTAIGGTFVGLLLGNVLDGAITWILAYTAGAFIYIALADTIHVLHEARGWKQTIVQFTCICCGIIVMVLLLLLE